MFWRVCTLGTYHNVFWKSINCNCLVPNYPYEFLFYFFVSFFIKINALLFIQVFMHHSLKLEEHSNPIFFHKIHFKIKVMKTYQSSIKQNTQQREAKKRYQMQKTLVLANEESSKEGELLIYKIYLSKATSYVVHTSIINSEKRFVSFLLSIQLDV